MNWETLFSILGQIATLVTIILVFLTLKEMRNQRIASQKPDLILPKSPIYGYVLDDYVVEHNPVIPIPRHWHNKKIEDIENFWNFSGPIVLYNVGVGVAKNISLKWSVDYSTVLEQIKDYCYYHSVSIIVEVDEKELTIVENYDLPEKRIYILSPLQDDYQFLMPVSITSKGLDVQVPGIYKEITSIIVYLKTHYFERHINDKSSLEISVPSAKLKVFYSDLENYHYSKSFDVVFSLHGYSTFGNKKDIVGKEIFQASLDFVDDQTDK